ncbi:MAG: serine/threonine protein kinase, partial [Cyanobacteria bacterium]|nr:serine/threonine protein kinase [Cyanobacteriota bacterium]
MKSATLTQWIFRPDACTCSKSNNAEGEAVDFTFGRDRLSSYDVVAEPKQQTSELTGSESVPDEDSGLSLDPKKFPSDRYQPLSELGQGASGLIYRCRDRLLNKEVAIKTLRTLTNKALVSFQEEAKATSKLLHPNIVTVMDFGVTRSSVPYLVMDFVKGQTLDKKCIEVGVSVVESIHIGIALCDALDYAHRNGVFHRDIKPSNVLLAEDDSSNVPSIKLIDFGVAKVKEELGSTITYQSRTIVGTPAYMSPDVVLGEKYDARSEVYSLGCLMFEVIEGHTPFAGEDALSILRKHVEEPVPELASIDAPQQLKSLVSDMLAKSPDDTPSSMQQVMKTLQSILAIELTPGESETTQTHSSSNASKNPSISKNKTHWMVYGLLALSLVLVSAGLLSRLERSKDSKHAATKDHLSKATYRRDLSPLRTGVDGFMSNDGKELKGNRGLLVANDLKKLEGDKRLRIVSLDDNAIDD